MRQESYFSLIKVYEDDIKDQIDTIEHARKTILALKNEIKVIEKELQNVQSNDTGITEPETHFGHNNCGICGNPWERCVLKEQHIKELRKQCS